MPDERWQPFATRNTHKPIPRETLFEFLRGHDRFLCELRDHGQWGIEVQFYKNEEFFYSHRLPTRELAVAWAEKEREYLRRGLPSGSVSAQLF